MTWSPLVWQLPPPALPMFDPQWNAQCLGCKHVHVSVDINESGVRVLRCKKTKFVGGGGKHSVNHAYCVDTLFGDCKEHGWHEPADA